MSLIEKLKSLYHNEGVNKDDWDKVHPNLLVLADYVFAHTETYNLPMVITSIIRPKIPGVSKTDIHAKGRAFDLSVRGWSQDDIDFLVDAVNETFKIGAISLRDGKEREAVFEDDEYLKDDKGNFILDPDGDKIKKKTKHFHFQVRT